MNWKSWTRPGICKTIPRNQVKPTTYTTLNENPVVCQQCWQVQIGVAAVTNKEHFLRFECQLSLPLRRSCCANTGRKGKHCRGRLRHETKDITVLWPSPLPWSQPLNLERQHDASCCLAFGFAAFALPFAAACNKNSPRESGQAEAYTMLN